MDRPDQEMFDAMPQTFSPEKGYVGNDYQPYTIFSNWRAKAELFEYHIFVNGKAIARVLRENLDFFDQSISINVEDCSEGHFNFPLPLKIEVVCVEDPRGPPSIDQNNIGLKRKLSEMGQSQNFVSSPSKKRTSNVPGMPIKEEAYKRGSLSNRKIYVDTIFTIKDNGVGTDRSGRAKIIAKSTTNPGYGPPTAMVCAVYLAVHASIFWAESEMVQPVLRRNEPGAREHVSSGLKGYTGFLCIRDVLTKQVLFKYQKTNLFFNKIESPFRQTVSMQLLEEALQIPIEIVKQTNHENHYDPLRLVCDFMLFDCNHRLFWSKSAFMWTDQHPKLPIYNISMLMPPNENGNVSLQFQVGNGCTTIRSCTVSVGFSKIGSWFDQRQQMKVLPVSKILIDISQKPADPLDIFALG